MKAKEFLATACIFKRRCVKSRANAIPTGPGRKVVLCGDLLGKKALKDRVFSRGMTSA